MGKKLEFSEWEQLENPLPHVSCFIRTATDTGKGSYLKLITTLDAPCPYCWGTGIRPDGGWEWFSNE